MNQTDEIRKAVKAMGKSKHYAVCINCQKQQKVQVPKLTDSGKLNIVKESTSIWNRLLLNGTDCWLCFSDKEQYEASKAKDRCSPCVPHFYGQGRTSFRWLGAFSWNKSCFTRPSNPIFSDPLHQDLVGVEN